ncbi:2-oxoglutarate dehydrogenase, E2 component, dihydrolipoamide succinyltransferase [Agromyces protaetiae]|uniref:Dihydrolipoamide acetyltransferase component of pyruvate dehydrogenase complex n=1 Tax=Agromyces protaetiae TaxID=2509455 RepID=A0A4P6FD98_9MICO|nr:2-oxoglutarate dehydrogenase, E2 component, dihydrolipoamide succinyltransferase [Agromyces protaetiae]QAY74082.1 2-oxoglutarate dehydrogenase, E2 component, dihydrolipoamide succinyltransferase [Agromyces protaetiae]
MSVSVSLPALGESVTEGTVTRWLKNVGDRVEVDEPLLEVSTDKVDTEIPSPVAGVIEAILVQEDETVEVGAPLVTIGDGSAEAAPAAPEAPAAAPAPAPAPVVEAPAAPAPAPVVEAPAAPTAPAPAPVVEAPAAPATPAPVAAPPAAPAPAPVVEAPAAPAAPAPAPAAPVVAPPAAAAPAPVVEAPAAPAAPVAEAPSAGAHAGGSGYVTPIVRKLANEQGVDLTSVTGTGVGGRIRKQDVLAAQPAAAAPAAAARPVLETSPLRGTTVPMTRLRKVVAERAVVSMTSTAQLTSVVEVDVTKVARLRDKVKGDFLAKTGNKLSFLPFFALAAAEALRAYPIINSTVDGDSIVYPAQENISIAVDTERGLLTPVVRDASSLDIAGLAAQIADLAERTRNNQLKPDELSGGTFTLTNTGSRGALFDTPVVFLPQSAILGTGIVVKRPVVLSQDGQDTIAIRSMVYLALSYDHRIIDGADAARFLTAVKDRLESGDFEGDLGI